MSQDKDDKNHKERLHLFDKPKVPEFKQPDLPKRPEAKEAPPVATTREVKDGPWITWRFRH